MQATIFVISATGNIRSPRKRINQSHFIVLIFANHVLYRLRLTLYLFLIAVESSLPFF